MKTSPTQLGEHPASYALTGQRQKGSVLIIGLVLLLVVTILAVAGVQDTILQERMSGNLHDRNLAFQASEAALRAGEGWLNDSMANRVAAEGHTRLQNPAAWQGATPHGALNLNSAAITFPENPVFYINPPSFARDPGSMGITPVLCDRTFPIYAHGVGGTINARVTLQGTVLPSDGGLVGCPVEWGG